MLFEIANKVKQRLKSVSRSKLEQDIQRRLTEIDNQPSFKEALSKEELSFIFEIKRTSPSMNGSCLDIDAVELAHLYESSGAAAISVLTEPDYFAGSLDDLYDISKNISLPLLRKDFIIDEIQIYQAKAYGASAYLLITALLTISQLQEFINIGKEIGLDALVEVHSADELKQTLQAGAEIIGVNSRNLKTMEIDLNSAAELISAIPAGLIKVAESGIKLHNDVELMKNAGADALLIGTSVVQSQNVKTKIKELIGK